MTNQISNINVSEKILNYLDFAGITSNKATHYETKESQLLHIKNMHDELFNIDRSIYALLNCLNGVNDINKQETVLRLLSNPVENSKFLTKNQETMIIGYLLEQLPITNFLRTSVEFRKNKINNHRSKRLILVNLFKSPDDFVYWAVKYRRKLKYILEHVWGKRTTGIIKSILNLNYETMGINKVFTKKEIEIINKNIFLNISDRNTKNELKISEALSFVLGNTKNKFNEGLFKKFFLAKKDLNEGVGLPYEVLDGIRRAYHPNYKEAELIEKSKDTMTNKQKKNIQNKAKQLNVKVEFDANSLDLVELFIYAYKMGMNDNIKNAITKKAKKYSELLMFDYKNIAVIVDTSQSMYGHGSNKFKPISASLSLLEVFKQKYNIVNLYYTTVNKDDNELLVNPSGESVIYKSFVELLKDIESKKEKNDVLFLDTVNDKVEAVFILSDGYENAPAGRFDQVLQVARKLGFNLPVYQFSPVVSAHLNGVKKLSENISVISAVEPKSLFLTTFKEQIKNNLDGAMVQLRERTIKLIGDKHNVN